MARGLMRFYDERWRGRLAASGLSAYSDFAQSAAGEVVAETRTSTTRRLEIANGRERATVYLKQYRYRDRGWRHRLHRSKGAVEARNYEIMRERAGVTVPDVIAVGSRRIGAALVDAFIVTRGIDAAQPLDVWWRERAATGGVPAKQRRAVGRELLELLTCLHRVHFYHVDLQWRNILVREENGGVRLVLLDSSRGCRRRLPWMRWHFRMRDLSSMEKSAREFVPRFERIRFVHRYVRGTECGETARRLIGRIVADRRRKDGDGATSESVPDRS